MESEVSSDRIQTDREIRKGEMQDRGIDRQTEEGQKKQTQGNR